MQAGRALLVFIKRDRQAGLGLFTGKAAADSPQVVVQETAKKETFTS